MIEFALRRILAGLVVAFAVVTCVFFVTRIIGDPVAMMLPPTAPQEQFDQVSAALGFDRPIVVQYVDFLGGALTFDFGSSIANGLPVDGLILQRLPATIQLVVGALLICALVFVPAGVIAGRRPGSLIDRVIVNLSLVMISVPSFWLGAILIFVFAVQAGWLPTSGAASPVHAVLPTVTLSFVSGARVASIARASVIDELHAPYVTALRGRGFKTTYIVRRYLFRNALLPITTILFWEAAMLLANSLVVETVFAWPGIGKLIVDAVAGQDFPVLQGAILALAVLVVFVNTIADIVYKMVDPRIQLR